MRPTFRLSRFCLFFAFAVTLVCTFNPVFAQESAETPPVTDTETVTDEFETDAPANEFERWVGRLADAGASIPVLLLMSLLAVACILERAVNLRRNNLVPPGFVKKVQGLYGEGKFDEIARFCRESDSTMGRVTEFLVAHRNWPVESVTQSAGDVASRELRRHLVRAYPLAIIGALAPLIGLLGTVSGMVDAFDAVAVAGLGDVQVLGTSISKALVTTMVGLVVAIPALFAYHTFKSRAQLYGLLLEEKAAYLVNVWFMDAPAGTDAASKEDQP